MCWRLSDYDILFIALLVMNPCSPDSSLGRTCLSGVWRVKHLIQLLQCTTFRFHEEEIDYRKLKQIPEYKEDVEPVPDILQRNWRNEGIEEAGRPSGELEDPHGLGALDVVANLSGINGLHGGERESEYAAEDIDERNRRAAHSFVRGIMGVSRSCSSDDGKAHSHSESRSHEHLSSTKHIVEPCTAAGEDPACHGVDGVEEELGVCISDANVLD